MSIRTFQFGERVLIIDSKKRRYLATLSEKGEFHSHSGVITHAQIVGLEEGALIANSKGSSYSILRPTLEDFVLEMPRGAQVIYPKDLAPIWMSDIKTLKDAFDMMIELGKIVGKEEQAKINALKGDNSGSWGNQMRSYVLAPYQMVKDLRNNHETGNTSAVLNGEIDDFIEAGIRWRRSSAHA